jgi:FkbM family methyltransferase
MLVRSSVLYDAYLRVVRRDLFALREQEIKLYRRVLHPLPANAIIFDIGANAGHKADIFRRLPARVLCLEPDRANFAWLKQRFAGFKNIIVLDQAVSDRHGTLVFNVFEPGSALNTLSSKWLETLEDTTTSRFGAMRPTTTYTVETTTLDALLEQYGPAYFIKIDVEGHEVSVLRGLSSPVPFMSFEVNLPEFRSEGLECVDVLTAINPDVQFNYLLRDELEQEQWSNAVAFRTWLAETDLRYLEVFVRNR